MAASVVKVVNPQRENQFIAFFSRMPQIGNNGTNKLLKTGDLDFLNRTIKSFTVPGISLSSIPIPYKGHLDTILSGDTFTIDPINMDFLLDSNMANYKAFLNWALIQKDIQGGTGVRSEFSGDLTNVYGQIIFQFLDIGLKVVDQFRYEVLLSTLPTLEFSTTSSIDKIFSVSFNVVDIRNIFEFSGDPTNR